MYRLSSALNLQVNVPKIRLSTIILIPPNFLYNIMQQNTNCEKSPFNFKVFLFYLQMCRKKTKVLSKDELVVFWFLF